MAVCQEFEIEIDEEVIPRIAIGFGGGIGNTGSVCGAVAGATMGISLTMEKMFRIFVAVQEFRRRFEAEMETINCRELTGLDLTTEEGIGQLMSSDIPQTVCAPAVAIAYKLAVNLLEETS